MPEIWLPYGNVEVVVEVKAENLYDILEPKYKPLKDEDISSKLQEITNYDKILLLDVDIANIKILTKIFEQLKGKEIRIFVKDQDVGKVKKALITYKPKVFAISEEDKEMFEFKGISFGLPNEILRFKEERGIVISSIGFDPLFGFKGAPSSFVKLIGKDLIARVLWDISKEGRPRCGERNEAWEFASSLCKEFLRNWIAIESLSYHEELINIEIGDVEEAHLNSIKKAFEFKVKDMQRIVMVSPGKEPYCSTLSSSLLSIWNTINSIRDDGCLILVSECSEGLGSEALSLFTFGRITLSSLIDRKKYIEGLEDLIYLTNLKLKSIILVSTLPKTFVEGRLGLTLAKSVSDALIKALEIVSSRAKVLVVPKGNLTKVKVS